MIFKGCDRQLWQMIASTCFLELRCSCNYLTKFVSKGEGWRWSNVERLFMRLQSSAEAWRTPKPFLLLWILSFQLNILTRTLSI